MGWMRPNQLNPGKMEVLLVTSNLVLGKGCASMLDGTALALKASVCQLGPAPGSGPATEATGDGRG